MNSIDISSIYRLGIMLFRRISFRFQVREVWNISEVALPLPLIVPFISITTLLITKLALILIFEINLDNMFMSCMLEKLNPTFSEWGAFDSAKNHKRQRRKRQSVTAKREKSQTPKFV